jgi:hypothetical protein
MGGPVYQIIDLALEQKIFSEIHKLRNCVDVILVNTFGLETLK